MKIYYLPFDLELKHEFKISYHSRKSTPTVLIRVEQEGIFGYGEASLPPYLPENTSAVIDFLKKLTINDIYSFEDLKKVLVEIDLLEDGNSAAKAAVDIALHDLLGKILKKSCRDFYGINNTSLPSTSFTIGLDDDDVIKEKILEADSFQILKIKLGTQRDKEIIKKIRTYTDKPLYIDANQAWNDVTYALEMIEWLSMQNVILVEQPVSKNNLDGAAFLKENSPLPIIADEAFQRFADLKNIQHAYSGINIKLMKCAGIHEAFKIIDQAEEYNLKLMMGCMTETSCGISAAIQLASLIDYADLDGNLLINNDPFFAKTVKDGRLLYPEGFGIGIKPKGELAYIEL